jgi:protoporphyrinogen oxidase
VRDPGRVLIVGAGPTGLGAAFRLQELGCESFEVIEATDRPGGLAASVVDARGFTWDLGGHIQFSHYAYYDEALARLGGEWLEHERESWVWVCGTWVPYPFQYNLHRLPAPARRRALAGLSAAAAAAQPAPAATFGEWIDRTFGEGIAALFMRPYNRKVWGYPLDELEAGWVGDRVAVPDLQRVRRNVRERRDDVSWGPNHRFRFPLRGGTGWIWDQMAAQIATPRLRYRTRLTSVDLGRRHARLDDGRVLSWDTLISSIPLDRLCQRVVDLPAEIARAATRLRHSAVHILGVGVRGVQPEALRRKCWMYFPDPESPYYRVTVFSNYSPHHVPAGGGHWSLMAEVCETAHRPVDSRALPTRVVDALRRDGLLPAGAEVLGVWHHREEHGYPTPFLGRDGVLAAVRAALEPGRVFSRGRFGAWKYEVSNQDHSFMQGVEVADRVLGLGEEDTLERPALVNGGAFARVAGQVAGPRAAHRPAVSRGPEAPGSAPGAPPRRPPRAGR